MSDRPSINVTPESKLWPPALIPVITKAARAAYKAAGKPKWLARHKIEISVTLTNDNAMKKINCEWRGKNKPTNVLSFPQIDIMQDGFKREHVVGKKSTLLLGDVVLSFETIHREAKAEQKTLKAHVSHMVIHGVLHLLGYDHMNAKDAKRMEKLECDILAGLGYPDPYST